MSHDNLERTMHRSSFKILLTDCTQSAPSDSCYTEHEIYRLAGHYTERPSLILERTMHRSSMRDFEMILNITANIRTISLQPKSIDRENPNIPKNILKVVYFCSPHTRNILANIHRGLRAAKVGGYAPHGLIFCQINNSHASIPRAVFALRRVIVQARTLGV